MNRNLSAAALLLIAVVCFAITVAMSVAAWLLVFTISPYLIGEVDYPFGPALLFAGLGSSFLSVTTLVLGALLQWAVTLILFKRSHVKALVGGALIGLGVNLVVVYFVTAPSADLRGGFWFGAFAILQATAIALFARRRAVGKGTKQEHQLPI